MKIYIDQISKLLGKQIYRLDTVQAMYERISKNGLVKSSNIYVVQDDKSYFKNEKLWTKLPKLVKDNTVILVYSKVDKRSKFFKQNEYVPFNPLTSEVLSKYIIKNISLSSNHAKELAEVCECSYDRCMNEVYKINSYIGYKKSINEPISPDQAYVTLINDGAIYKPIGDITFDFIDAVMDRNSIARIETLMCQVRDKREPRLLLLSLLYTNFRNLLMCQDITGNNIDYEGVTGLSKFEINAAKRRFGRYSVPELKRALSIIQDLEFGVKTGTVDEDFSIDYFIAQVI